MGFSDFWLRFHCCLDLFLWPLWINIGLSDPVCFIYAFGLDPLPAALGYSTDVLSAEHDVRLSASPATPEVWAHLFDPAPGR